VPLEQIQDKLAELTLADVVDLALQNNPATRAAWADARAAAAKYGSSLGAWYPTVNLDGELVRSDGAFLQSTPGQTATVYGPVASLSYLLFDFGGRAGAVEESRQALLAADWTQNAVIQDTVLQVQVAFFNYAAAKALLEANTTSLSEAETNLTAAQERHRVGLATIADVLQAKTAFSEVKFAVQGTEGQVRTSRGALAVSMGYPANVTYDIRVRSEEIPDDAVQQDVELLIKQALESRPDLMAARAVVQESAAKVTQARSKMLPSLSASGFAGRTWKNDVPGSFESYGGALLLHIPVFTGFSQQYDLLKARAEAEAAGERARGIEQAVIYQVFSSHSDFLTATERSKTADDLMASARQSEEVALGRYQEGVGTILDLLSAQRALAVARAAQIGARLGWFTALAQLAHDAGILGLHGENPLAPKGLSPEVMHDN
jgi:outer membrane protein TolC